MGGQTSAGGPWRKRWLRDLALLLFFLAVALAIWDQVSPRSSPAGLVLTPKGLPAVPRPQRPLTLDPGLFSGEAAEGYRVARQRPALLEQMPCYCGCYSRDGHQNALDCFRERHAESCSVCLAIARRAEELEKVGYSLEDIRALIHRRFAREEN